MYKQDVYLMLNSEEESNRVKAFYDKFDPNDLPFAAIVHVLDAEAFGHIPTEAELNQPKTPAHDRIVGLHTPDPVMIESPMLAVFYHTGVRLIAIPERPIDEDIDETLEKFHQ